MDFRIDEFDVFEKGDFMETIRNVEINQLSFRTGCETEIQLSFGGLGRTSQSGF